MRSSLKSGTPLLPDAFHASGGKVLGTALILVLIGNVFFIHTFYLFGVARPDEAIILGAPGLLFGLPGVLVIEMKYRKWEREA